MKTKEKKPTSDSVVGAQLQVSPQFVVYLEYYVGIPTWFAAEIVKETDKTIKVKNNYGKPYRCYRAFINKQHDKYAIVKSEAEVLHRLKICEEAEKEYEKAKEKYKRILEQIAG